MKISLPQLHILTYVLVTTTTLSMPAYVPPGPVFDGYVDAQLIKNREPDFRTGTNLALEERAYPGTMVMTVVIAVGIVVATALIISGIKEDEQVSSKLTLLVLLTLTVIRHSIVRDSVTIRSPTCIPMTPHTTMLYAAQNIASHSMGPGDRIGIISITSWICTLEGR
jgi:hypothetical protein